MLDDTGAWTLYLQAAALVIGWAAYSGLPFLWHKEDDDEVCTLDCGDHRNPFRHHAGRAEARASEGRRQRAQHHLQRRQRQQLDGACQPAGRNHDLPDGVGGRSLSLEAPGEFAPPRRVLPFQIYPLDDDRRTPRGLALEGCSDCLGDGYWNCSTCDGEGEDEAGNPCEDCDGRGYMTCETCDGYGTVLSL